MLRPLADRILVKPGEEEEVTRGGIVLPDTAKKRPREGEVLAVGPGKLLDNGQRAPMEVAVGDVVVYSEYDKLHRLAQGRILELYGVTPEQMRMRP